MLPSSNGRLLLLLFFFVLAVITRFIVLTSPFVYSPSLAAVFSISLVRPSPQLSLTFSCPIYIVHVLVPIGNQNLYLSQEGFFFIFNSAFSKAGLICIDLHISWAGITGVLDLSGLGQPSPTWLAWLLDQGNRLLWTLIWNSYASVWHL